VLSDVDFSIAMPGHDQRMQSFAPAGLQMPMLLHVACAPVLSTGHVLLSPGVHADVHTWNPSDVNRWQLFDVHCVFAVHGSNAALVHAGLLPPSEPSGASIVFGESPPHATARHKLMP
jgi:hypothetical protein